VACQDATQGAAGDAAFEPPTPERDAGLDGTVGNSPDLAGAGIRLRVMAANTTSGNNQTYDPGEGLRIFQGLHPDIALVQEFNYGNNSETAIRSFVNSAFGTAFSYFRESGFLIPNGIVSRYPIVASGSWTDPSVNNRGFAWARIDLPGPRDLWAVSIHLLTASATVRDTEAKSLVDQLARTVPSGDYLIIGGNLNTDTRGEPCVTTFSTIVSTAAPFPADSQGNGNTNAPRSKPYDWVMPSPNLRSLATSVVIGAQSFPSGLVVDSRVYAPLTDIAPVRASDSGAANMQHMAVVEDFLLP
jgi:endonuclease/exonuclease/phosphatase family metal-dependent hydrolase